MKTKVCSICTDTPTGMDREAATQRSTRLRLEVYKQAETVEMVG
jgi:hypothetical protein